MTAYENITAILDRIEKVSKQGLNYAIELEDIEQLQEAQEQVKNIAYKPVLTPVLCRYCNDSDLKKIETEYVDQDGDRGDCTFTYCANCLQPHRIEA